MAVDVDRLLAEALAKHGIRLDPNDPAVVMVTLTRLALEDASRSVAADIRTATREFEQAASRVQSKFGAAVASCLKARSPADAPIAIWSPRTSLAVGLFSGVVLFLVGVAVGRFVLL